MRIRFWETIQLASFWSWVVLVLAKECCHQGKSLRWLIDLHSALLLSSKDSFHGSLVSTLFLSTGSV